MNQQFVGVQARFTSTCPGCGNETSASGGQALVCGRLEWSIEMECPACGALEVCGRADIPTELRERLLRDPNGPVTIQIAQNGGSGAVIMKVLRAQLGLDIRAAKAMLAVLQSGQHTGTKPEIEQLARALRAVGVRAEVSPQQPPLGLT